jgi:RhoGEF domain
LERALEQADAALQNVTTKKPKKQDAGEWQKVCKFLQKLEEDACDKGETGLAITLSKPFQRLLKYPLLFQNLLFHTDPSTFEYESTLQMVAEVETIVRSIEDEKIQKEERDKTRDVFARIEGLDKVKQLALPKPSRILVEERPCTPGVNPSDSSKPSSPPPVVNARGVKGRSSFKRLSDVLHSNNNGIGGKKDLWEVVFNDVVLQCQRTGTTSLPLVAATSSRTNSLPEFQGKAKYATTGRKNQQMKPRNLYKFIKVSHLHTLSLFNSYLKIPD